MSESEKRNKLHAVLAVEPDIEAAAKKIMKETVETFVKRTEHFGGYTRVLKFYDEKRQHEAAAATEIKELTTTVPERLDYQSGFISRWIDAAAQKEATNQIAKADIIVDGKTIAFDVPATLLLNLEHKLKAIRDTFKVIPTLRPGIKWVEDNQKGKGIYRAENPEKTHKTEKIIEYTEIAKATIEHPAQVEKLTVDKPVGDYEREVWSGMMSSADKAELLKRTDRLIQAVKMARQRANDIEVQSIEIASAIFDYLQIK